MTFDFEGARDYALGRLERELSPLLTYHCIEHTRDDVAGAAKRLAALEGITGEALLLLLTAVYYHDLGFVIQRADHEATSIGMARQILPRFGYTPQQIEIITNLIQATRLPQTPHNLLEQIMADADLDVLGREDFWRHNRDLRAEMEAFGGPVDDEVWCQGQIVFLSQHRYFTESARRLRQPHKDEIVAELRRDLHNCMSCRDLEET